MIASRRTRLASTPPQATIFAVGDVHGRLDLLEAFTRQVAHSASQGSDNGVRTTAVFLGDYIDRGPASAGVISHLIAFRDRAVCETAFLRGNHEQILLDLIDGEEHSARWLDFGGLETLKSYGLTPSQAARSRRVEDLRRIANAALPPEHLAFLRETELYRKMGDYLFVHAGLRPDRLLDEQADADLMWYRYYDDEPPVWSETVVHGHSTNPRPVIGRSRIGIDTEAYSSGILTGVRLKDQQVTLLKFSIDHFSGNAAFSTWEGVDSTYGNRDSGIRAHVRPPVSPQWRELTRLLAILIAILAAVAAFAAYHRGGLALQNLQNIFPFAATTPTKVRGVNSGAHADMVLVSPAGSEIQTARLRGHQGLNEPVVAARSTEHAMHVANAGGPRVQISAARTERDAIVSWRETSRAAPELFVDRTMILETVSLSGRQLLRTQVEGFTTTADANSFCRKLRALGRSCIVRSFGR
jgi:serine/threonine protein phosphatase 1